MSTACWRSPSRPSSRSVSSVTVCCRASASLRSRPAVSSSCWRSESSASYRLRSSASCWSLPSSRANAADCVSASRRCSASASCSRAISSPNDLVSALRSSLDSASRRSSSVSCSSTANWSFWALRASSMSVRSRLRSASCAASCSACRVADSTSDCSRRLDSVTSRNENQHRPDGVGRARVGAGVQLEGVSRPGEADQIDFKGPALAPHRAIEERLAGLPFLGRHHVHQRGAENLLQRLRAEHG